MDAKTIVIIVVAVICGMGLFGCLILAALLLPAVQSARTAARTTQSKNNLRQIGLSLHNYHDRVRSFPPGGVFADNGTPHHSWQTMLLPYMDQTVLYNTIDFDRPWTDPVNSSAMNTVISTYLNPNVQGAVSTAGGGASHYAGNRHMLSENSFVRIRDVIDGSANTIMAGEVAAGYRAWGDPQNFRDPADGIRHDAATFGGPGNPGGTLFQFVDGSVRTISSTVDPEVLKALATRNGGEIVSEF
jgi:hypothetical protein